MTSYEILSPSSRVWIYQAQQPIPSDKIPEMRHHISEFVASWVSHNRQLRAFGEIYHNQFIVLMVDESLAGASGCSIDTSVRFLQQLEQHYGINLFDRMTFAYKENDTVKSASRELFSTLFQSGAINEDTLVFDNLVNTKEAFEASWLKPLKQSWHKRMV